MNASAHTTEAEDRGTRISLLLPTRPGAVESRRNRPGWTTQALAATAAPKPEIDALLPNLAAVGDRWVVRPQLPLLGVNPRVFVLSLTNAAGAHHR